MIERLLSILIQRACDLGHSMQKAHIDGSTNSGESGEGRRTEGTTTTPGRGASRAVDMAPESYMLAVWPVVPRRCDFFATQLADGSMLCTWADTDNRTDFLHARYDGDSGELLHAWKPEPSLF